MNAHLIDALILINNLKNDAELSRRLEVAPPVISKWRHEVLQVGATGILNIHETFEMPVKEIRHLIALAAGVPIAGPAATIHRCAK